MPGVCVALAINDQIPLIIPIGVDPPRTRSPCLTVTSVPAGNSMSTLRPEPDQPDQLALAHRIPYSLPAYNATGNQSCNLCKNEFYIPLGDHDDIALIFDTCRVIERGFELSAPVINGFDAPGNGLRFTWTLNIERKMLSFVTLPTRSIFTTRPSAGETITRGSDGISRRGLRKKNATKAASNSTKIATCGKSRERKPEPSRQEEGLRNLKCVFDNHEGGLEDSVSRRLF